MNKSKVNIILFLLGKLVSLFGTRIYAFAMSLYILKVTKSPLNFSISILVSTVPALIFTPIGGVIADRFDRKRIVLLTDFLSGIIMFGAFGLSHIFGLQLWIIYLASILLSIMNSLFTTSFDAALPNIVDKGNLGKVNAYNQAINSVSSIVAPVIGGAVYALINPPLFILFNGISFVLSTFSEVFIDFYYRIEKQVMDTVKDKVSFFSDIKNGFMYLKKRSRVMIIIESALILNFVFTVISVAVPQILVVKYPISDKAYGMVQAAFSIGALIVSVLMAKKLGEFKGNRFALSIITLGIFSGAFAIPLIFTGYNSTRYFMASYYGILFFLLGCLIVIINIPFMTYIQETTDDEYRGRVMSLLGTIASAISPLGYLLHGILLEYVPTYVMIIYASIVLIIIGLYIKKRLEQEPGYDKEVVVE